MNDRMPCRITDDPYYDYSDWEEGTIQLIVYCFTFAYCNTIISNR